MIDGKTDTRCDSSVLPAGTMLRGRYRVEQALGQGGFGITYSALDIKTNHRVAVKELFPAHDVQRGGNQRTVLVQRGQESSFAHMRRSFEQEAQTLIQLQSQEGVVRLLHLFSENETAYYVMELLEGEDLSHRLQRGGAMSWEQLSTILKPILNALEQIHAAGLIHRDISPDNIFLTSRGARLIDFGSVRAYQGIDHLTAFIKHSFAPWEQYLTNGKQGPWTDVYALCVTAYYALSGILPPTAPERRVNDTVKPLQTLCPRVPQEICQTIHHGMSVHPEDRYQSVAQLRQALFRQSTGQQQTNTPVFQTQADVQCVRGSFAGTGWRLGPGSALRIGRSPECEVVYPSNFQGVSRMQCTLYRTAEGRFLARDEHSSFGTRLLTMGKTVSMEPGIWYCADDARIFFGRQEEYLIK